MFRSKKEMTIGIIVGSLVVITIIGLVYAAFTQQLNIGGSGNARNSVWHVYFSDLSNANLVGTATEQTHPTIQDNATSIKTYAVSVATPGDSITYTFKVNNDGDYDAKLTGLTLNTPTCTGTDSTSNTNVCGKLRYTLKYENGTSVAQNDMLASKESKTMVLKLEYQEFDDASLLPTSNVTIDNLGIDLVYTQEGKAKTNADGTTPYVRTFAVGDSITVANESYHIISVPANEDYVVALKDNPLTVNEINTYGAGHVNRYTLEGVGTAYDIKSWDYNAQEYKSTGYGGMAYYSSATCGYSTPGADLSLDESGCTTSYNSSEVKYVVDAWAAAKFTNSELKTINGYGARLITKAEYEAFPTTTTQVCTGSCYDKKVLEYDWVYNSQYWYWTMSSVEDSASEALLVTHDGYLGSGNYRVYGIDNAVRPVINVYKSKI